MVIIPCPDGLTITADCLYWNVSLQPRSPENEYHVPWGFPHTSPVNSERHWGRHRNGRAGRAKVSESDRPNMRSDSGFRHASGGLMNDWWIVKVVECG